MTRDAWEDSTFAADWDEAGNLLTNPDRLHQLSLLADLLAATGTGHLLDLGIGSAQVESAIRKRHTTFFDNCRVSGIDASQAMLELAQQRCAAVGMSAVELIQCDFSALADIELGATVDAVICVQALHEVPHQTKQAVFTWVREQLAPGRPFFILDRFEYAAEPWLADWQATWNWMRSKQSAEVCEFDAYHRRYSAKTDHIASVADYRGWLDSAGFDTLCPYYCFNRALIIAR